MKVMNRSSMSASSDRPRPEHWRYETAVGEIESIIDKIESGELDLEDVFGQFSQAVTYLQDCEAFLAERQTQIDVLIETLGDVPHP